MVASFFFSCALQENSESEESEDSEVTALTEIDMDTGTSRAPNEEDGRKESTDGEDARDVCAVITPVDEEYEREPDHDFDSDGEGEISRDRFKSPRSARWNNRSLISAPAPLPKPAACYRGASPRRPAAPASPSGGASSNFSPIGGLKRTDGDDSPLVKRRRSASGDRVDVPPEASDGVDPHSKLIDLIFRTSF
mmetsp:Transcript_6378/g.20211  ORF Transcript_6378/g.20211 Transcript_6378/m.20211 type:complete len:194 (+) Transcript_6378:38-619(+)